jgi:hypothetical protein
MRDKVLGFNLGRPLNSSDEFHKTAGETRSVIQYTYYFVGASKDPRFRKRLSIPDERARPVPAKDGLLLVEIGIRRSKIPSLRAAKGHAQKATDYLHGLQPQTGTAEAEERQTEEAFA